MKTLRILLCWMLVCFLPLSAAGAASPVLGSSTGAMSPNRTTQSYGAQLQETALGCYVADSLRAGTGAQLSIICGGLRSKVYRAVPSPATMSKPFSSRISLFWW